MTVQNSKITFTRKINNTICIFNFHKSSLEHHSEETLKQIATYQELAQYRILTISVVIKKLLVQFLTLSMELVGLLLDIRHMTPDKAIEQSTLSIMDLGNFCT